MGMTASVPRDTGLWVRGHEGLGTPIKVSMHNLTEKNKPNTFQKILQVIKKGHRDLNYYEGFFPRDFDQSEHIRSQYEEV